MVTLVGAGCGPFGSDPPAGAQTSPLAPVLAGTVQLISGYQATLVTQPGLADRLNPLLADHQAHARALLAAMGQPTAAATASPSVTPSAVPADPTAALAQLRTAEAAAQADAVTACVAAPAGNAALLGSIAACRATHVEALT